MTHPHSGRPPTTGQQWNSNLEPGRKTSKGQLGPKDSNFWQTSLEPKIVCLCWLCWLWWFIMCKASEVPGLPVVLKLWNIPNHQTENLTKRDQWCAKQFWTNLISRCLHRALFFFIVSLSERILKACPQFLNDGNIIWGGDPACLSLQTYDVKRIK